MNRLRKLTLNKVYEPDKVEEKWYNKWIEKNLYGASNESKKKPYCIVIPPPNITGSLHLGHALDNTIQDILIRGKRMMGYEALWIPGTDHAGIATQNVVEKELAKEKITRYDLGREEFIKRVWKWKEQYGQTIVMQLKRMGVSCDWSRERFTLDDGCSKAVREAFVRLFKKGQIYKGQRIISWCPRCLTALSDLEVEHKEVSSKLYYLRYPSSDGKESITIATTRPETILADVAVCVHPEDKRYLEYKEKYVILPIVGRKLPVINDRAVDPKFGTGALKITPGHDPVDFEIGQNHKLPMLLVINEKGFMNSEAGKYEGLERFKCREAILEDLRNEGYLEKEEDYNHSIGHCSRCDTVIEPYLSWQWFVKMKDLAKPAIDIVKNGKIRFVPEKYTKVYLYWMENIRDWCISRQLWWGHRIPVWTCQDCGFVDAFLEEPKKCPECGKSNITQEEDVLDTWFSSGLWPISIMGWPEDTPDLKFFYPTDVLVTARDIIFLWVARMIMMGLEFRGEIPFRDVNIHATILDKKGRRMSKSLGNGVDPLVLMDEFGTDATRFGLIYLTAQGQDIKYSAERIEMSRNFGNKIWNAARFCLSYFPEEDIPESELEGFELTLFDRWILSRVNALIETVTDAFNNYSFDVISRSLYDFFWDDFCDWYIEIVKPLLNDESIETKARDKILRIFDYIFSNFLRLLHPIMPFITEELWSLFKNENSGSISFRSWPIIDKKLLDESAEKKVESLFDVVKGIRSLRSDMNLSPKKKTKVYIHTESKETYELLEEEKKMIENLAVLSELTIIRDREEIPQKTVSTVVNTSHLFLPVEELENIEKLIERMEKELAAARKEIDNAKNKLSNESFVKNAPQNIIDSEKAKEETGKEHFAKINKHIEALKRIIV